MATLYHNPAFKGLIPESWIKDEDFVAYYVNEQNLPWKEGVDQGPKYQILAKYEEYYGLCTRIGRAFLGALLSLTVFIFSFQSGKKLIENLLFDSVERVHFLKEEVVDVEARIAGNPAHMGHIHMIALAVNRLMQEGYQINRVNVRLSEEEYLRNKVHWTNVSIEKHNHHPERDPKKPLDMLRVFIPRIKRIEFLRAAIKQAKDEGILHQGLDIDYFNDQNGSTGIAQKSRNVFLACGADFAEDLCNSDAGKKEFPHVVIVMREGEAPQGIAAAHTETYTRFIVSNSNQTSLYSSSKIQNGAYEQLPEAVREDFKRLHQEAQPQEFTVA